jgi:hypothetical protein
VKRNKTLFTVTAVAVPMLLASTLPAMATSPADSVVFYPHGNGATYSCTDGSSFIVDPHSPEGNCTLQQIGPPSNGLVCDAPTTITFVHDMRQDVEDGMLCQ